MPRAQKRNSADGMEIAFTPAATDLVKEADTNRDVDAFFRAPLA
jgi:hypothetical protein